MNDTDRVRAAWTRIEAWLASNLPAALDNLCGPPTEEQLATLEAALERPLPSGLRTLLSLHDGEQDVEDGIIFVQGPVKPRFGSRAWIPFSTLDGHVQRYIDFEPAPGGTEGQVIETDPESCTYRVLAPSFADFLEGYADSLERGEFEIDADGIRSPEAGAPDPTGWGVPSYLSDTPFETSTSQPESSAGERSAAPDEVVLEGEMGVLMGGPEVIFSLETADGREHTFLANRDLTRGYAAIAVCQRARVRARPCTSDTPSYFVDQAGSEPPDFIAIEYSMLR